MLFPELLLLELLLDDAVEDVEELDEEARDEEDDELDEEATVVEGLGVATFILETCWPKWLHSPL